MGTNEMHAREDEAEAVAQLQAMGFEWSGTWSHWDPALHHSRSTWQRIHNGKNAIVLTAMSGWWAVYGRNQAPLGVTHPLDVVEWVRREMDANG
jgi:hypothetical protein